MTPSSKANHCPGPLEVTEPEVGNYFVANYPPFSVWSEKVTNSWRHRLDRPRDDAHEGPFGLYVHIPFCVERCTYCYYLSTDDRLREIDDYLAALTEELAMYSRTKALGGRVLEFVYFGGGTPSILPAAKMRQLFEGLKASFGWESAREVTFECAPKSTTRDRLEALRDAGVTRISLGAQQLDDRVLAENGRVHQIADVERAWELIQGMQFPVVNVDLIAGLVGETDESFFTSLGRVIQMRPASVTIYPLEIPLNTPLYKNLREGELVTPPPSWEVKRARVGAAFQRLEEAGYEVRSAYSAVRDPVGHAFLYQDVQYNGADLLGIGASAFSYLNGVNHQNNTTLEGYVDAVAAADLPLGRAYTLDDKERLVRRFVLQLKLGRVPLAPLRDRFGVDPLEFFAPPLAELSEFVEVKNDVLFVKREGLIRIDRLIPAFYLPKHRGLRYS